MPVNIRAYKYYEEGTDPFQSIVEISPEKIERSYRIDFNRFPDYINYRSSIESFIRQRFMKKGGRPVLLYPIYFSIYDNQHYKTAFKSPLLLTLDLYKINKNIMSFTFGRAFDIFKRNDKNVYLYDELIELMEHGNTDSTIIEMQLWDKVQ